MVTDLGCVVHDDRYFWKFAAQHVCETWFSLKRDDSSGRAASAKQTIGEAASSGAEFEHRAGPREIDATSDRIGKSDAAWIGCGDGERPLQPEAKKNHRVGRARAQRDGRA